MRRTAAKCCGLACLLLAASVPPLPGQKPPYDVFPPAEQPYSRVRYEASDRKGELPYADNYTIWIPPGVKTLRGVVVHQHGCGEGSCKSGLTGVYDLHWQALARKHDCALLSPAYEQPEKADCQLWCDPRNGSDAAFRKCLADLGARSGHPELAKVPWALWGHSGGGHWAGGMVMLHPDRVAAAWLRSGVPLLKGDPSHKGIRAHTLPDAALKVPVMCNLGTKEGVTVKDKNFAGVWPANEVFFHAVRGKGGLVGVAIDPLSSHDCGNQRYLAIPWLDACLSARLPKAVGDPLVAMPTDKAWLAPPTGTEAAPAAKFVGEPLRAAWLPNEAVAKAWMEYVKDTKVSDTTPPPAPTNVRFKGNELTWDAEADLESGLASFVIERDGRFLANVPEQAKNPFGRPVFQNLQYSDTPTQPLVPMRYTDANAEAGKKHGYRVIAVNTVGVKSNPSVEAVPLGLGHSSAAGRWEPQTIMSEADFRGLSVVGPKVAWVSGTKGTFARTTDGGKNWSVGTVPEADKLDFRAVKAFGALTAYLLSAGPGEQSRVYKTTDGGKSWALQFKSDEPKAFFDALAFWDEKRGIALGDPINGRFQLVATDDGGGHWNPLPGKSLPEALPNEAAFAASGTCLVTHGSDDVWFCTGGAKKARVFHSGDRGRTWTVSETPLAAGVESAGAFSLAFRDGKHGVLVGGDYRKPEAATSTGAVTRDGGKTWTPIEKALPFRSCVAWAKDRWVAVGTSGSDFSADDGATWKSLDQEKYNSVGFAPTGEGWAVGPKGRIAKFAKPDKE